MGIPGLMIFPIGCGTEQGIDVEHAVIGIIGLLIWEDSEGDGTLPG